MIKQLTDSERTKLEQLATRVLNREAITYEEYVQFVTLTGGTPIREKYDEYCVYIQEV